VRASPRRPRSRRGSCAILPVHSTTCSAPSTCGFCAPGRARSRPGKRGFDAEYLELMADLGMKPRTIGTTQQVASAAGFGSVDVIRRTFVRLLGITPRRYRELAGA
jgi:AraC-like DNA-binding protein